jgi:arylsulfatase A-like enzyme
MDRDKDRNLDRRTFIKGGLAVGGLLGAGLAFRAATDDAGESRPHAVQARQTVAGAEKAPNILVILVDQLRYPQWFSAKPFSMELPPNMQRIGRGGVSFARHYAASNDCTPSRAALLTGLYTHQTGCMITGGSTLDAGFPTWGTMLREQGYHTRWYGKWHLTHHDNWWSKGAAERTLERYGFAGGTAPSPDGAPGQGWHVDPRISAQFSEWCRAEGANGPWCTTVSFVNPHDIAWWYVWTDRVAAESQARQVAQRLPPNFETPQQLIDRRKPALQRSLQNTSAASFGPVPFEGPGAASEWLEFMNLYAKLQREVDRHVGHVLDTLEEQPEVAANTIIVFTSDHGEYAASHGLRGKGAAAYEEGIRVPLVVKDPRGTLTNATETPRTQLTSHVDIPALLLTVATGSNSWRSEPRYSHIAQRADLARILSDPYAPGRDYVLHATDEVVTEFALEPYAFGAPLHVVALRTAEAKLTTYTHWKHGTIDALSDGEEAELYDYSTHGGRLEVENSISQNALEAPLRAQLHEAIASELHEPLPARLRAAQRRGFYDYFSTAKKDAKSAALRRRTRAEHEPGGLPPAGTTHLSPRPRHEFLPLPPPLRSP